MCPFKTASANHLTVTPGITVSDEFNHDDFDELKTYIENLKKKTSGPLRKYIDNTLKYLDYVEVQANKIIEEEEKEIDEKEN